MTNDGTDAGLAPSAIGLREVLFQSVTAMAPAGVTTTACGFPGEPTATAPGCPSTLPDTCTMTEITADCSGAVSAIKGFQVETNLGGQEAFQPVPIAPLTPNEATALVNTHEYFGSGGVGVGITPVIVLPSTSVSAACSETIWFTTATGI